MSASKSRRGLLVSVLLMGVLSIMTIFSTKYQGWKLRSYFSTNDGSSLKYRSYRGRQSSKVRVGSKYIDNGFIEEKGMISTDESDNNVENDYDDYVGEFDEIAKAILDADDDEVLDGLTSQIQHTIRNIARNDTNEARVASPACHPHFNLALPNNQWNNTTKFKRIYFYHARKAGGSSMNKYLAKVADHYGLELKAVEWGAMEEPSTFDDEATFYVTHLREPVDRAISQFKYQGRWSCPDLVGGKRTGFVPTLENANSIETWNQTGGHVPFKCKMKGSRKQGKKSFFFLGQCAVNCYTQWFSGICPQLEIPLEQQYQVARAKLLKYNMVVVIEKLRDPRYVEAVERYFGVTGLTKKGTPFCERESHKANEQHPLDVPADTRKKLENLNQVDISLYREMSECLDSGHYNFPEWSPGRFALHSYNASEAKAEMKKAKAAKLIANEK